MKTSVDLKQLRVEVPCNGCRLCCQKDAIRILPHEDPEQWQTEPHDYYKGERMLAHKPNGDCIYLGDTGCTIHGSTPMQCRTMDCRNIAQAMTWTKARKMAKSGLNKISVWKRGKELLRQT